MKLAIFTTGEMGTGKTSLVRCLGLYGWNTFHSGAVYQHYYGSTVKDTDDVEAPKIADDIIYKKLMELVDNIENNNNSIKLLAVESIPRKLGQHNIILELEKRGWNTRVMILRAKKDVRLARVINRDIFKPHRVQMDKDKFKYEDTSRWDKISKQLLSAGISYTTEDTSENFVSIPTDNQEADIILGKLVTTVNNLKNEKSGYSELNSLEHYVNRAKEELDELLCAETSKNKKDELIDVIYFLTAIIEKLGMSDEIINEFIKKSSINQAREQYKTKIQQ